MARRLFRERGLTSPAELRAARAAGTVPGEIPGAVFLLIDGWAVFREEFELLEDRIGEIAAVKAGAAGRLEGPDELPARVDHPVEVVVEPVDLAADDILEPLVGLEATECYLRRELHDASRAEMYL